MEDDKYTFSLDMITPGNNIRDNEISLFNMKPHSKYILSTVEVENQAYKQQLLLFINGEYNGIYYLEHSREKEKRNEQ